MVLDLSMADGRGNAERAIVCASSGGEDHGRVFAFEVDDMQRTIAVLRKEKVTITDEPYRLSAGGSLIAFIEDPDGTLIELIEKK